MPTSVALAEDRRHIAVRLAPHAPTFGAPDANGQEAAAMRGGVALHFAPEREIYGEGEAADSFYKVASGVVRTCKFLSDGSRQIDAFHAAGDIFGLEAGARHWLSAEAVSACTVLAYPRQRLDSLAMHDGQSAQRFLSYAMQCLERAQGHSILLGRRNAVQKVATFLLEMQERRRDSDTIELPMARQDIADYLGLTIETVSRTLSQMERDGVITLLAARRVRVLNAERLLDLSD